MKSTIYPIKMYNSTFGSLTLIRKIFNPSIEAYNEWKKWEKLYDEADDKEAVHKSYVELTKSEVLKPQFNLIHFDTFRGPVYRIEYEGKTLPLREDQRPDPSFISKGEKHYD